MKAARLLIAGSSSGVGKTTVTLGLCAALRRRGIDVRVFKCGPDYLDPTYHRIASGQPVHNLDSWLMDAESLRGTFQRSAGELSLIEGVMGLFDGASPTALTGSSAEIAGLLGAPIVLVCDASGMARSVAAVAHGFATFEPSVRLAGVLCNRAGSRGHLALLGQALSERAGPRFFGGLCKNGGPRFPERHLGLRTANEIDLSPALAAWADQVEADCDVEGLLALARAAPDLALTATPAPASGAGRCRIGIAEDAAFHFYYEANLRLLEQAGATLVRFSPLTDPSCGELDGVYIGGGYPELHARQLAHNHSMLESLRALARAGKPVYAECGGLMYLSEAIVSLDGEAHPMLGLVPGRAQMTDKLQALGYVEVETRDETALGPAGTRFRGHQFRYSRFEGGVPPERYALSLARSGARSTEGYGAHNVLGSYVHAHWSATPEIARRFVASCLAR